MLWYEQLQEEERKGKEEQERIRKEVRRNFMLSNSRFKAATVCRKVKVWYGNTLSLLR